MKSILKSKAVSGIIFFVAILTFIFGYFVGSIMKEKEVVDRHNDSYRLILEETANEVNTYSDLLKLWEDHSNFFGEVEENLPTPESPYEI